VPGLTKQRLERPFDCRNARYLKPASESSHAENHSLHGTSVHSSYLVCFGRPLSMRPQPTAHPLRPLVFGPFEFDEASGELRKHGVRVRLQGQPLQILAGLIRQPGKIVTREEFQQQLWSDSTFVDFDHGLNAAMNRLRQVLGDSADHPRYIETLQGRGYRFVAAVQDTASKPVLMMASAPDVTEAEPAVAVSATGEGRIVGEEVWDGAAGKEASLPAAGSRRSTMAWAATAGLLAIVGAIGWWMAWRPVLPADRPLLRLSVDLGPEAVTGGGITAAISPDGNLLAFFAHGPDGKQHLATRLLDRSQITLLSGAEDAEDPFFSPDGQWIGFFAEGKMKKVSVRGGAVITLCDAPDARGGAWGEDGNIIATLSSHSGIGLSRVPATGGTPQAITRPGETGEATHRWPQILPGGQAVLFTGNKTAGTYDSSSIEILSLKTGQVKVVQRSGYFGRYLPGGYLVYIHHRTLFGVRFDLDRLEVRGTPVPLLADVSGNSATAGGQLDFSRDGTLVYLSGKATGTWTMEWLDSAGRTQPLLAAPAAYYNPRFSPDGKRLAFSSGTDIEIYDRGRDSVTRLTFTVQAVNYNPVWTPDGKHIVFESEDANNYSLQWIRAEGAGEALRLLESKDELHPYSFSPDGKRLAFSEQDVETGMHLWTLPLDIADPEHPKPGKPELFLRTPFNEDSPAFSPDGRWIAYSSTESGRGEVFVRPFPAGGLSGTGKWMISSGGGQFPMWSHGGRELFYESPDNHIMAAAYTTKGDSFSATRPRPWSNTPIFGISPAASNLDATPDGKRFVVMGSPPADSPAAAKNSVHVIFLLNFFDEVRRRIPTRK